MDEAIYRQFSDPGFSEISEILSYAIKYANQNFHVTLTIEHIVYGFMKYCEVHISQENEDYSIFPWYVKPESYEALSSLWQIYQQKERRKKFPLNASMDVILLAQNYKQYFSAHPKQLDVETFYHLIAFLKDSKEYDKEYVIPYVRTYKINRFQDFICTESAHTYINKIMESSDTKPKAAKVSSASSTASYYNSAFFASPLKIKGTTDITYRAYKDSYSDIIGRKHELSRLIDILSKMKKNNAVLIGNPGVGKTAIVYAFARRIVNGDVPHSLKYNHILELDLADAIAGSRYRGDFEEKIKSIFDSIIKCEEKVILYIDEIHTSVELGSTTGNDSLSLSDMIKPFSTNPNVKIIGTSTFKDFKHFEQDKALERRFDVITVEEPSFAETLEILNNLKFKLEKAHGVKIAKETFSAVIKLSNQYIPEHYLPDKAIDILDETCAIKANSSEKNSTQIDVTPEDVLVCISRKKNIPIIKLQQASTLENLEENLTKKIIGQPQAISVVSQAIRRAQAGLNDETRPLASFMFIGPTGVGKTEIAKTLAEIMFSERDSFIRIDMSEYMEEHSVSKLIGSPPGYIGYENAGLLTEQVRRHPYSIVLFDEFEKAHLKIANLLLQILDDGILTDSHGDTINFKNTVIILTSNVGVREHSKTSIGFGESSFSHSKDILNVVKKTFPPEFLNRLDEIVQFNSLSEEDIFKIAKLHINTEIISRLKRKGITISIDNSVIKDLAQHGYSYEYGARELKRTIMHELKNPLADFLLKNQKVKKIAITIQSGKIKITANNLIHA